MRKPSTLPDQRHRGKRRKTPRRGRRQRATVARTQDDNKTSMTGGGGTRRNAVQVRRQRVCTTVGRRLTRPHDGKQCARRRTPGRNLRILTTTRPHTALPGRGTWNSSDWLTLSKDHPTPSRKARDAMQRGGSDGSGAAPDVPGGRQTPEMVTQRGVARRGAPAPTCRETPHELQTADETPKGRGEERFGKTQNVNVSRHTASRMMWFHAIRCDSVRGPVGKVWMCACVVCMCSRQFTAGLSVRLRPFACTFTQNEKQCGSIH